MSQQPKVPYLPSVEDSEYDDEDDHISLGVSSSLSQTFERAEASLDSFMANVNNSGPPGAVRLDDDMSSVFSEDDSCFVDDLRKHLHDAETEFQLSHYYLMAEMNFLNALNKGAPVKGSRQVNSNKELIDQYMQSLSSTEPGKNRRLGNPRKSNRVRQRIQAFETGNVGNNKSTLGSVQEC